MSSATTRKYLATEYLELEQQSELRHEYIDGEIVAMAGGSIWHAMICDNVLTSLKNRMSGGPCRPFSSALRVKIQATGNYTYPDVSIACGAPQLEENRNDTLLNPRVLIEVLSPSTERGDRGWKFRDYQLIPSFEEYVLVSQDEPRVERFWRQGEVGWLMTVATGLDAIMRLEAVPCDLPLVEVYEGVTFNASSG